MSGGPFGKLPLQIGYKLLRIGTHAVEHYAHLRTSLGPTFCSDHSVIGTGRHRLLIGASS
jgi:hypothetical protein